MRRASGSAAGPARSRIKTVRSGPRSSSTRRWAPRPCCWVGGAISGSRRDGYPAATARSGRTTRPGRFTAPNGTPGGSGPWPRTRTTRSTRRTRTGPSPWSRTTAQARESTAITMRRTGRQAVGSPVPCCFEVEGASCSRDSGVVAGLEDSPYPRRSGHTTVNALPVRRRGTARAPRRLGSCSPAAARWFFLGQTQKPAERARTRVPRRGAGCRCPDCGTGRGRTRCRGTPSGPLPGRSPDRHGRLPAPRSADGASGR